MKRPKSVPYDRTVSSAGFSALASSYPHVTTVRREGCWCLWLGIIMVALGCQLISGAQSLPENKDAGLAVGPERVTVKRAPRWKPTTKEELELRDVLVSLSEILALKGWVEKPPVFTDNLFSDKVTGFYYGAGKPMNPQLVVMRVDLSHQGSIGEDEIYIVHASKFRDSSGLPNFGLDRKNPDFYSKGGWEYIEWESDRIYMLRGNLLCAFRTSGRELFRTRPHLVEEFSKEFFQVISKNEILRARLNQTIPTISADLAIRARKGEINRLDFPSDFHAFFSIGISRGLEMIGFWHPQLRFVSYLVLGVGLLLVSIFLTKAIQGKSKQRASPEDGQSDDRGDPDTHGRQVENQKDRPEDPA